MVGRFYSILVSAAAVLGSLRTASAQDRVLPGDLASDLPPGVRGRLAQEGSPARARSEEHLARELQDPLSSLPTLRLQNDVDADLGPDQAGFRYSMTLVPALPLELGDGWLLLTHSELPIIYQHEVFGEGSGREFGLGDLLQRFLLCPDNSGFLNVGVGPALVWPTATRDELGEGKWSAGPAAAMVVKSGMWTAGVLTHHLWSFAGSGRRDDVNRTFLQPFVTVTFNKGTSLFLDLEAGYDWHADQWTVPIIAGFEQVLKFGDQPLSLGIDGKYWVEGPSTTPDWGIRVFLTFIFPR